MAPDQTVHLFTGSKIGYPGPRVGFLYTEAQIEIDDGSVIDLTDIALTEASSDILFANPGALRGFEALLHDEQFNERGTLWDVAEEKLVVYRENRQIMLDGFEQYLSSHPDYFSWTTPGAGFFSVFTFLKGGVRTDDEFVMRLVSEYGVVAIPMYGFYPADAQSRDPDAGYNQLRLSFCFTESGGDQRRADMREAVAAFCQAALKETGLV
jgi:DNA-binding transcriptional MocR family regulator